MSRKLGLFVFFSLFGFAVAGCVSFAPTAPEVTSHLLDQSARRPQEIKWSEPERLLRLQRVELPDHLNQHSLVYRDRSGSPVSLGSDLWAEPLHEGIGRVLAGLLEDRVPGLAVVPFPFSAERGGERWRLAFRHFEAWEGRGVLLDVTLHWTGTNEALPRQARLRQFIGETEYQSTEEIVAALYLALESLAAGIVDHL